MNDIPDDILILALDMAKHGASQEEILQTYPAYAEALPAYIELALRTKESLHVPADPGNLAHILSAIDPGKLSPHHSPVQKITHYIASMSNLVKVLAPLATLAIITLVLLGPKLFINNSSPPDFSNQTGQTPGLALEDTQTELDKLVQDLNRDAQSDQTIDSELQANSAEFQSEEAFLQNYADIYNENNF